MRFGASLAFKEKNMKYKNVISALILSIVFTLFTLALASSRTTQLQYNDNTGPYFQYLGNPFGNGNGK